MKVPAVDNPESVLTPLYAGWMAELLGGYIPAETEATCGNCAMCADGTIQSTGSDYVFDAKTKCCTYIPELPNFLVGRMLNDGDSDFVAGRATLETRLKEGVAVTPLGIGPSPTDRLLYEHTARSMAFGRNPGLRCPHYLAEQGGRCGIWRHRTSVCATWFCKHVRGAVGVRFWRSVHQLLMQAESDLMHWCVSELDVGTEALRRAFPPPGGEPTPADLVHEGQFDGRMREEVYKKAWGNWSGREQEFFRACGQLVEPFTWQDVTKICGPQIRIFESLTTQAYKNLLSDELPVFLKVGGFNVLQMRQDLHRIKAYSPLDPIDVPQTLMGVLHYFDGRPTSDALRTIALETGLQLDEALVRRLVDFGILVA